MVMIIVIAISISLTFTGCKLAVPQSVGITTGVVMSETTLKEKGAWLIGDNPTVIPMSQVVGIDESSITLEIDTITDGKAVSVGNMRIDCSTYKETVPWGFVSGELVDKGGGLYDYEVSKWVTKVFDLGYLRSLYPTTKWLGAMVSITKEGGLGHVLSVLVRN